MNRVVELSDNSEPIIGLPQSEKRIIKYRTIPDEFDGIKQGTDSRVELRINTPVLTGGVGVLFP